MKRVVVTGVGAIALAGIGFSQLGQLLKIGGVAVAIKQFGPQMNSAINRISNHKDTYATTTKVVPILTVGIGASHAIGGAQIMGPRNKVDQVVAVAQPDAELFGHEVRVKALIPVSSKDVIQDIKRVDGVGVSGIVDIKL
ncbi:MAG: hypothetical protein HY248_02705 [Fimbriimonas ginsengisoli]|uniref:Uncharacterized protein n=1 Tax=Fimbriimonas ginsengisoli TaxID=1005039 RepID=A0A931LU90_FIMGI|nr:hypothetical protein [Fimbriimonas ginsengisoli]MBI3721438.1 hypothetical protein [Fimbriimonas ginsengisoli]